MLGTLTCEEQDPPLQNLTDVNEKSPNFEKTEIVNYPHLRFLKLNNNALTNIDEVKNLKYLLSIEAKNNQIETANFLGDAGLQYLQKVNLTTNKLKQLPKIQNQALYSLNLDENEINELDFFGNSSIRFLSLNKNKLTSLKGFTNFKAVESISLQENEINNIEGLSDAPELKSLNLANNKLESLSTL